MRGLNLETDPRALPKLEHPQFRNLSYRSEAIVPRAGLLAYTPPAGTLEAWLLGKVGTAAVVTVPVGTETWAAYADFADRVPRLRDEAGAAQVLALAPPAQAPTLVQVTYGRGFVLGEDGLAPGETRSWALGFASGETDADALSSPGPTLSVTNDFQWVEVSAYSNLPQFPADYGITITGGTSGATAKVAGWELTGTGGSPARLSLYEVSGVFQAETITWTRTDLAAGSGTIPGASAQIPALRVTMETAEAMPAGATRYVHYALDDAGYYHRTTFTGSAAFADAYSATGLLALPAYPGPLDADFVPEASILPGAADVLAVHKRCLFLFDGPLCRYSEGDTPRVYRENATLNFGAPVLAAVSRGEVLEVYTTRGARYVVGEPGGFELRETQIREGIVGRAALWPAEWATLAVFPDGLWSVRLPERKSLSVRQATPWFAAVADLSALVVGASEGIVYVADGTRVLALDWEAKEWFDLELPAAAVGFLWSELEQALIVKTTGGSYLLERGGAVDFVLQSAVSGSLWTPLPPMLRVAKRGTIAFEVWGWFSDDETPGTEVLLAHEVLGEADGLVMLPAESPNGWYWIARGTGTAATHAIRDVRPA